MIHDPTAPFTVRERIASEWTTVAWAEAFRVTGFSPADLPGVRELPRGGSDAAPFYYSVHRSVLPLLGGVRFQKPQGLPVALPEERGVVLRPHQIAAVRYIRERRGTLLADEQRVGKSAAAMFSHEPEDGPCLVVGPVAARAIWHEWAARRFGTCMTTYDVAARLPPTTKPTSCSICARVAATSDGKRPSFETVLHRDFDPEMIFAYQPHVVFISLALVGYWSELYAHRDIGTLIVDECHLAGIQSRDSRTMDALKKIATVARRIIFMSGTPLYNRPRGMFPILDTIAPGSFGGYWDFCRRYADAKPTAHGWQANGRSRESELAKRLGEMMLRRRWCDIQANLPPLERSIDLVSLDDATISQVEAIAQCIQFDDSPVSTIIGYLARLRRLYGATKTKRSIELVQELKADGHGVVVWTWHRDVAETIAEALRGVGFKVYGPIHGEVPAGDREWYIEQAAIDPAPIIVATMGSLATAVNLSFLSHEIFVELDWTPVNISQAEMRPYDGKHAVSSTFLVADCEPDRALIDALMAKLKNAEELGLGASVGDVREILQGALGIYNAQTLGELAERLMANAEAEC